MTLKVSVLCFCLLVIHCTSATNQDSCAGHAKNTCSEPGDGWTSGPCNSIYGGFTGNTQNLKMLMVNHFQDSFKFLFMAHQFNSDEVNRIGLHDTLNSHSDKMWQKGKSLMNYILKRGGNMGNGFQLRDLEMSHVDEEVEALGVSLDILKKEAENCVSASRHALNKKHHDQDPTQDSFDPLTAHFLEEEFIEDYSDDIRDMAGKLNVLARISRSDKTRSLGLHLFDSHLVNQN